LSIERGREGGMAQRRKGRWGMRHLQVLAVVAALVGGACMWSAAQGAGDAAHFLRDGVGARPRVLGGAFVAVADDLHSLFWNPAGIVNVDTTICLGGTHETRFGGLVSLDALGVTVSEKGWALGAGWVNSDMYSVITVVFAAADKGLSVGLSPKFYQFGAAEQRARGLGLDAGVLYEVRLREAALALGLVTNDIGWTRVSWPGAGSDVSDRAAWVTRLGGAVVLPVPGGSVQVTADGEAALRRPPRPEETDYVGKALQLGVGCGVELSMGPISVRAGLAGRDLERPEVASVRVSFGAGVAFERISIDAGWVDTPLGGTYLLSVQMVL